MRGSSFQADRPIPEGAYRVVNYDETVQLLPADETADSDSRGRAWASYSRYHEHLPIPEQDPRTNRISRWLAQEILSFEPRHALELGCGAGRNLYWLEKAQPGIGLRGIEINPHAAALAREWGDVNEGSIYELRHIPPKSIDVVFTSGVLMHVPSDRVESVIRSAHRIARKAVIHFELHGPSYSFDYHRYPRDYGHLYRRISLGTRVSYKVFPRWDFRSRTTQSFRHALLVSRR
jgi:SAM-dependent methyltransferase